MSRRARGCIVASESLGWTAEHRAGIASGPIVSVGTNRFRFFDALGPIRDDATVADSIRRTRRSGIYAVESRGTLPFGVSPSVRHVHKYGGTRVHCTTDWRFPRNSQFRNQLAIGSCELNTTPSRWRPVSATNQMISAGDWQDWPEEDMHLPSDTLAITVEMTDGTLFEMGFGEDLWRWRTLSAQAPNASCGFTLGLGHGGAAIIHKHAVLADTIEPPPRTWRFSWYATWQPVGLTNHAPPLTPQKAIWWSDDSLDTKFLQRATSIGIDLSTIDLPKPLCHNGTGASPCMSAAGVQKRLKHAMRQISELTDDTVPVIFSGWQPQLCNLGRHVDRKGEKPHWDWVAMLDFCAWARNHFGPDRHLAFDTTLPIIPGEPFLQLEEMIEPMDDDELYT